MRYTFKFSYFSIITGGKDTIGNGLSELENGNFGPREDILWTVGWDQYIREERHNSCIEFTITRMELLAGAIVRVMLGIIMSSNALHLLLLLVMGKVDHCYHILELHYLFVRPITRFTTLYRSLIKLGIRSY
jgi:hypothetical protein